MDSSGDAVEPHPRDQRDRHHEPVRGGVGGGVDGADGGGEVLDARLRVERPGPNVFREEHKRSGTAGTAVERSLLEVESYVRDFAEDNPT